LNQRPPILRDAAKTPLLRMRLLRIRLRDDLPNPHGEERGDAARLEPEATDPSRRGEDAAPQDEVSDAA
jgi:hypothetical protein